MDFGLLLRYSSFKKATSKGENEERGVGFDKYRHNYSKPSKCNSKILGLVSCFEMIF
jgi:hypothetical protein